MNRRIILYSLPALALLFTLLVVPLLGTFYTSFLRDVSYLDKGGLTLSNYTNIFQDPTFWQSLAFTIKFAGISVPLELLTGLIIALLIDQKMIGGGLLRAIVLIPWAIPSVVSARIWELIFNYSYGMINLITSNILGVRVNWFGEAWSALLALVVADLWRTTPFVALVLLAGLQSIPPELYKQARVDGAGRIRTFFGVTLPLLVPFLIISAIFRTADALRVFDIVFVITEGGPANQTMPLSLYAYRFYAGGDFGKGSAVSVVLFLASLLTALVMLGYYRRKRVVY